MADTGPTDYELLYFIRQDDEESMNQLIDRYRLIIWKIVHQICRFTPIGFDKDDLFQEGMMGLMDAINAYRDDKDCRFSSFASVCIERQIRSFLRRTRSQSYKLLSDATSLDAPLMVNEDDLYLKDVVSIDIKEFNPVYQSMINWASDQVPLLKSKVNDIDWKIYHMFQIGYTYKEIANDLNVDEKDVDNALQKVKRKMRSLFDTE